jgi:hypothetical protein
MLVCLPLALWAVNKGHRWLPLLLFVAYLILAQLISRMLPRPAAVRFESQQLLQMLASLFRFLGIAVVSAALAAVLSMPMGGFKGLPRWATVLMLAWWLFVALVFVLAARWVRRKTKHAVIKVGEHANN